MQPGWTPQIFETCELGVSSAYEPVLIPDNQLSWMRNGRARGGKASTRPFLQERLTLPLGLIQGVSYFSIQSGMLVMQIAGNLYRIRVSNQNFAAQSIPLPWENSPVLPQVWMQETVGSLVVQDGQSYAIIYDGSTARRSDPTKSEVPLGRQMAFGNGRLWVAINDNELVAGDIKTKTFQSELKFTESQYFSGGGAFYFPFKQNALAFVPASGAAGYGALMVYGKSITEAVRADIAARDLWPTFPGFIQYVLGSGAISHYSLTEANQDLFWRAGDGGIRSLRSSAAEETQGPGNTPISREVSRITDYESVHRLDQCSAINFNNRLLMTASPFINIYGTTSYRNLISMDFAPLSSMRSKAPPAYDGQWDGLNFVRVVQGEFQDVKRAFAVTTDDDGNNRLWEFVEGGRADTSLECVGTSLVETASPVPMILEYPARTWGDPKRRKRLERCDVFLAGLDGESVLDVYWRADNYQKWSKWDDTSQCAKTTDAAVNAPHTWKNLLNQERPQTKTFSIPDGENLITQRALHVGFEFQIRIVLRGKGKIYRTVVYASMLDEEQFADRGETYSECIENDITGNDIPYQIPVSDPSCTAILSFKCRTRSGVATLCGFPEFLTTASIPPRKYLRLTTAGLTHFCYYVGSDCVGGFETVDSYDFDGAEPIVYDPVSCTRNTGHYTHYVNNSPVVCAYSTAGTPSVVEYDVGAVGPPVENLVDQTIIRTLTTWVSTAKGLMACVAVNDLFYNYFGIYSQTLSDEDTDADAIARLFPDPDGDWSSFTSPDAGGCCTTSYEPRGAGKFDFVVREAQVQVQGTGYIFGIIPKIDLVVYRAPINTTDWEIWQTLTFHPTVASNGTFMFVAEVPLLYGYETYAVAPGTCTL